MQKTYACFIRDRRYSVPTLRLLDAQDDAAARLAALDELAASGDHLAIELQNAEGQIVLRRSRVRRSPALD